MRALAALRGILVEARVGRPRPLSVDRWSIAVFVGALALLLAAGLHVITTLGPSGDEPWYLLQGYSLVRDHSVDMTRVMHDSALVARILGGAHPDRPQDFTGNGGLVIAFLPGYAALVGPLYAFGERAPVVIAQALAGALTALLIFHEAGRLWRSRAVALFATLAYVTCLPVLLYAGQIFPSTLASAAAFGALVLVARALPRASGRRLVGVCAGIGGIALALPWLHTKYIPLALVMAAAALAQLFHTHRGGRDRAARIGAVLLAGLPALSLLLVALYSRHYFGTWYPQYRSGSGSFSAPDVSQLARIYGQMFVDAQSGLIPWAPLPLLAPVGAVVLARRHRRAAALLLLWIAGLLSAFLATAVAPHVNEAFALPARFTVEIQPYLALCAAAMFAEAWPALRAWWRRGERAARLARMPRWGVALGFCCLALLCADVWLSAAAQTDLWLLYPSAEGVRLAAAHPHLLPQWWFALFPAG